MQHKLTESKSDFIQVLQVFYNCLNANDHIHKQVLEFIWDYDERIQDWCCEVVTDLSAEKKGMLAVINDVELLMVFEKAIMLQSTKIYTDMLERNPRLYILFDRVKEQDPIRFIRLHKEIMDSHISTEDKLKIANNLIYIPLKQLYLADKMAFSERVSNILSDPHTPERIKYLYNDIIQQLRKEFPAGSLNLNLLPFVFFQPVLPQAYQPIAAKTPIRDVAPHTEFKKSY